MFFGQKIHPLNFDIPDQLTIAGDGIRLTGPAMQWQVRCADIAEGCLRLRFENARSADSQQHSDAVLPELRKGRPALPMHEADTVQFAAAAGVVALSAAQLRLDLGMIIF